MRGKRRLGSLNDTGYKCGRSVLLDLVSCLIMVNLMSGLLVVNGPRIPPMLSAKQPHDNKMYTRGIPTELSGRFACEMRSEKQLR